MGTIGVHEFITVDGVIGDPSWSFDYSFDPEIGEAIGAIIGSSKAILLGRRTYQEFAPSWSTGTAEEDPGAPFMNKAPKYVVSASLQAADWNNSILGPCSASTIRDRKDWVISSCSCTTGSLVAVTSLPTTTWPPLMGLSGRGPAAQG